MSDWSEREHFSRTLTSRDIIDGKKHYVFTENVVCCFRSFRHGSSSQPNSFSAINNAQFELMGYENWFRPVYLSLSLKHFSHTHYYPKTRKSLAGNVWSYSAAEQWTYTYIRVVENRSVCVPSYLQLHKQNENMLYFIKLYN